MRTLAVAFWTFWSLSCLFLEFVTACIVYWYTEPAVAAFHTKGCVCVCVCVCVGGGGVLINKTIPWHTEAVGGGGRKGKKINN